MIPLAVFERPHEESFLFGFWVCDGAFRHLSIFENTVESSLLLGKDENSLSMTQTFLIHVSIVTGPVLVVDHLFVRRLRG